MATILRFETLFLLLVCLANMVTAKGQSLRLLSLQRTESADKTSFTFTAKFKAEKKPTADWWELIMFSRNPLSGSTLDYDESTKEGTTSVTWAKGPHRFLNLDLGDKGSQFFSLWWKTTGEGDLNHDLDLPVCDVTPSTDVPYSSGKLTQVQIEVNKTGSNGFTFPVRRMLIQDAYQDKLTDKAVQSLNNWETLMKTEVSEKDGIVVTTLTINTDKTTYNGFVRGTIPANYPPPSSPLETLRHYVVLSVHEDKYTGPFPEDVYATWVGNQKGCLAKPSYHCIITCEGFGNNINSMEVYKLGKDGTSTPVEKTALTSWKTTKYYWTSTLKLDTTKDFDGTHFSEQSRVTYVCQVTGEGGKAVTKVQQKVARIEKLPKVQSFTKKTLADGNMELTCTAEGTGPLTVKVEVIWVELQQGKDGVVSYSPGGPSAEGSEDTVTASAVVPASSRSYVCRASNLAAKFGRWLYS